MSELSKGPFSPEERRILTNLEQFCQHAAYRVALTEKFERQDEDPAVVNATIRQALITNFGLSGAEADEAIGRAIIRIDAETGEQLGE